MSPENAPAPPNPSSEFLLALNSPSGKELQIRGISASQLCETFGTPLYAFDAGVLHQRLEEVRQSLGEKVNVLFAVKANSNLAVAKTFVQGGAGLEVASAGELFLAKQCGVDPSMVQFAGPGKGKEDLQSAVQMGIYSLNAESEAEVDAISFEAECHKRKQGVAIRVNPPQSVGGSRMRMGGGSKKFGIDLDNVPSVMERIHKDPFLILRGLHIYAGTQCFSAEAWVENADRLLGWAMEMEESLGIPLPSLNFGGGFGVAYFQGDNPFDLDLAGKGLTKVLAKDSNRERRYFVELGRFLCAPAGVYLCKVVYLKQSHGKTHAILDGGMHQHSAAAGVGSILRRAFPIVAAKSPFEKGEQPYTLGGPLCTPADEFAADYSLPHLKQGDIIAILGSGGYGLTFSNHSFLSHPTPAEVLIDSRGAHLVRLPGKPEDILRDQQLPRSPSE
jgi:diaminopimelate decarboxylase